MSGNEVWVLTVDSTDWKPLRNIGTRAECDALTKGMLGKVAYVDLKDGQRIAVGVISSVYCERLP